MTSLCSLVNKEGCLFVVQLYFGLVLLELNFIHVLNLIEVGLIDKVHDTTSLESTLEPKSIRVDSFLVHTVLTLCSIKRDTCQSSNSSSLSLFEVDFDTTDEPLRCVLHLASRNFDLLSLMVKLARLDKFVAVRLS